MQLTFSLYSVAGLLIMLGAGLMLLGTYQRWIYPAMRASHEKAKMTGSHGADPSLTKSTIKIIGLLVFPALGFAFGDLMLSGIHG